MAIIDCVGNRKVEAKTKGDKVLVKIYYRSRTLANLELTRKNALLLVREIKNQVFGVLDK